VSVSIKVLEKLGADAWVMSPPCQPFTRQGLKKDVEDGRAESFMRLVDEMTHMDANVRPKYVFVENVVGFETSRMRQMLIETLQCMSFYTQEFILTPTMFGIPYSRPRYFMCARSTSAFVEATDGIRRVPPPVALSHKRAWIPKYDEARDAHINVAPLQRFLDAGDDVVWREHAVIQEDIDRAMGSIDIVGASDITCNCFTKSYSKYVKGTGSVISNHLVDKSIWDGQTSETGVRLRYFTVDEVARLHSLPPDFKWPENLTKRQRYTLLGNSMSVACVAPLFEYLFSDAND
jgi:tRNA (cytosine38-C5)-methyltransferase